jgi:hypothetical protein
MSTKSMIEKFQFTRAKINKQTIEGARQGCMHHGYHRTTFDQLDERKDLQECRQLPAALHVTFAEGGPQGNIQALEATSLCFDDTHKEDQEIRSLFFVER